MTIEAPTRGRALRTAVWIAVGLAAAAWSGWHCS